MKINKIILIFIILLSMLIGFLIGNTNIMAGRFGEEIVIGGYYLYVSEFIYKGKKYIMFNNHQGMGGVVEESKCK